MRWLWPTQRGWILCAGAVYLFVTATMYNSFVVCAFASSALALTLASLACALVSLRGLVVQRGPAGEAAAGQLLSMPLIVSNRLKRRRQTFIIRERCAFAAAPAHFTLVDALGAREERVVNRRILTQRRGGFEQRRVILRGGDPAGLFYRERAIDLPQSILITPAVESLPDFPWKPKPTLVATAGSALSVAGTSQEVYSIREHHAADGLRNIHWKSSAKFGRLMVREFERDAVMSIALLVDAEAAGVSGPGPESNLEYQVRAAASIITHVADLYCQVAFAAGGARRRLIPPAPASQVKANVLYELALLEPGPVPLAEAALDLAEKLPRDGVVICLSLAVTPALENTLRLLALQGMTVRWFCADKSAFQAADRRQAAAPAPVPRLRQGMFEIFHLRPGTSLTGALCHGA
jgi:uncharacterized protein (DUF58 family)